MTNYKNIIDKVKKIAIKREEFMKEFLKRFYLEWEGEE